MKKPQHWFSDGVNMQEYLAFVLVLIYSVVALTLAVKVYLKDLSAADNEFFWTLSWPVMVILGFYFGAKVAVEFGKSRFKTKAKEDNEHGGDHHDSNPSI
jgi:hypothetical protein